MRPMELYDLAHPPFPISGRTGETEALVFDEWERGLQHSCSLTCALSTRPSCRGVSSVCSLSSFLSLLSLPSLRSLITGCCCLCSSGRDRHSLLGGLCCVVCSYCSASCSPRFLQRALGDRFRRLYLFIFRGHNDRPWSRFWRKLCTLEKLCRKF